MVNDLWPPLVLCPECKGDGWVFYKGTTPPTGDDPSDDVPCPTCKSKFFVSKLWADAVQAEPGMCTFCCKEKTVAEVWMGGNFTHLVCYPCYETLGL